MNNKGFTLIELIGVIIIIGLIAIVAVPSFTEQVNKSALTTFIAYENSMEDAAKNAVLDCIGNNSSKCSLPGKGDTLNISLDELIEEGFIDEFKSPKGGSCDLKNSYVKVTNRGNLNYKFNVCLICDDYKSDNVYCR
jgi:prepilin-type N-terminal cleavage/methylation domain-containing protein